MDYRNPMQNNNSNSFDLSSLDDEKPNSKNLKKSKSLNAEEKSNISDIFLKTDIEGFKELLARNF